MERAEIDQIERVLNHELKALRHVLALDDLFPSIEDEARDMLAGLPATAAVLAESAAAGPSAQEPPASPTS